MRDPIENPVRPGQSVDAPWYDHPERDYPYQ